MAISTAQLSVNTSAVALNTASDDWTHLRVAVPAGGQENVHVGGSGGTASTGCVIPPRPVLDVTSPPGDVLDAIKGEGGAQVDSVRRVSWPSVALNDPYVTTPQLKTTLEL